MNNFKNRAALSLAAILTATLAACGGSGGAPEPEAPEPIQEEQPPVAGTGVLNLGLSDGPIKDAEKVCIRFDGVQLKKLDEDAPFDIDFVDADGNPAPQVVNLLAFQGANFFPLLADEEVPAGTYEWIRLKVQAERGLSAGTGDPGPDSDECDQDTDNSYLVRKNREQENLYVPSGSQRGLQLIKEIIVPVNSSGDYTAEWDLRKSFNAPPGQAPDVMMKPVVKLVSNNEVGTLVGQVADELVASSTCDSQFAPSVYVFNDGVNPSELDDPLGDGGAVATGLVEQQMQADETMEWRYSIGFLLAGNYEAAFTCNGEDFVPLAGKPAEILLDQVTTVDFLAEDAPGTLTGQVAGEFFDPEAPESGFCSAEFSPLVYVFEEGVEPNFTDEAVSTGEVTLNEVGEWRYSIALQAANYNAALTCTGTDFIPAAGKAAEILPATETIVDFLTDDAPEPVGSLGGRVAMELVADESCTDGFDPAVYVFGEGVAPNPDDAPVAMGMLTLNADEDYDYSIESLIAGSYTAAFTCTGADFVPVEGKPAVITIGETETVDFGTEFLP